MSLWKVSFWKWYLGVLKSVPRALLHPFSQYIVLLILYAASSIVLAVFYSPLWLLLTTPLFFTGVCHSYWRWQVKNKKEV